MRLVKSLSLIGYSCSEYIHVIDHVMILLTLHCKSQHVSDIFCTEVGSLVAQEKASSAHKKMGTRKYLTRIRKYPVYRLTRKLPVLMIKSFSWHQLPEMVKDH